MSYSEEMQSNFQQAQGRCLVAQAEEVEAALYAAECSRGLLSSEHLAALLSPAAFSYLEDMARIAEEKTKRRFGKTVQLFAPMYVSNICQNVCTYCGFSFTNKIPRMVLQKEQILREAQAIRALGFQHVLVVSGEAGTQVGLAYFLEVLELLRPMFAHIAFEVQPLETEEYRELAGSGMDAVLVYQETYHEENYRQYHPKGKKSNFHYRLQTPDRLGEAGVHKIGLGVLLGLEDWRAEALCLGEHLSYLRKKYWKTKYSVAFPRLRPAQGIMTPQYELSDKEFMQILLAFRLFDEQVEITLSTREPRYLRDNAFRFAVTTMSAGSKTEPGGYACNTKALEQFEISDERSPQEVAGMLHASGYEVVWKDWDEGMNPVKSGFGFM